MRRPWPIEGGDGERSGAIIAVFHAPPTIGTLELKRRRALRPAFWVRPLRMQAMADLRGGEGGEWPAVDIRAGGENARAQAPPAGVEPPAGPRLAASGSFKGDGGKLGGSRRRATARVVEADDFINLLHGSDPVKVELNRLENEVRGGNVLRIRRHCVLWVTRILLSCCVLDANWVFAFIAPDKDRELGEAQAEIKALRLSERAREKAVEEVLLYSSFPFFF